MRPSRYNPSRSLPSMPKAQIQLVSKDTRVTDSYDSFGTPGCPPRANDAMEKNYDPQYFRKFGMILRVLASLAHQPCDSLVLQDSNHYTSILRLGLGGLILSSCFAFSHRTRSQHVGECNPALLQQDIADVLRALLAKSLIHSCAAAR